MLARVTVQQLSFDHSQQKIISKYQTCLRDRHVPDTKEHEGHDNHIVDNQMPGLCNVANKYSLAWILPICFTLITTSQPKGYFCSLFICKALISGLLTTIMYLKTYI